MVPRVGLVLRELDEILPIRPVTVHVNEILPNTPLREPSRYVSAHHSGNGEERAWNEKASMDGSV